MRKRVMAVGAVVLLIVGAWLGDLFRGFGTGDPASSDRNDESPPGEVQANLEAAADVSPRGESERTQESAAATPTPQHADDVLTVLIDGDSYELQSGDDANATFAPATLEELVAKAKTHPGNPNGVRVRLRFRRDSQEGARADLIEALQLDGIQREQIIEATDFVE